MIIDAVMNGETPIIMMERLEKPPPEKTFKRPRNWLLPRKFSSAATLMPGMGIAASKRKTTRAPSTNKTRLLRVSSVTINLILRRNVSHILKNSKCEEGETKKKKKNKKLK